MAIFSAGMVQITNKLHGPCLLHMCHTHVTCKQKIQVHMCTLHMHVHTCSWKQMQVLKIRAFSHSIGIVLITISGAIIWGNTVHIVFIAIIILFNSCWIQEMLSVTWLMASYILCRIYYVATVPLSCNVALARKFSSSKMCTRPSNEQV